MVGTKEVPPLHMPRAFGSWASQRSEKQPEGILIGAARALPTIHIPKPVQGTLTPASHTLFHVQTVSCVSVPLSFPDCRRQRWGGEGALWSSSLQEQRVLPMN